MPLDSVLSDDVLPDNDQPPLPYLSETQSRRNIRNTTCQNTSEMVRVSREQLDEQRRYNDVFLEMNRISEKRVLALERSNNLLAVKNKIQCHRNKQFQVLMEMIQQAFLPGNRMCESLRSEMEELSRITARDDSFETNQSFTTLSGSLEEVTNATSIPMNNDTPNNVYSNSSASLNAVQI